MAVIATGAGVASWLPLSGQNRGLIPGYTTSTFVMQIKSTGCIVMTITEGQGCVVKTSVYVPAVSIIIDTDGSARLDAGAPT